MSRWKYCCSAPWFLTSLSALAVAASGVVTSPASPKAPRFLLGKNEKHAETPNVPAWRSPMRLPIACAASSITGTPAFAAIWPMASMSAHWPNRCTGMIAFVRGVIADATAAGSRLKLTGSMSTRTGRAPTRAIDPAVAKNE